MRVTIDDIMAWQPCCDRDVVEGYFGGRESMSPVEIADCSAASAAERLWVLLREAIIPRERLFELGFRFAEDVLELYERAHTGDDRPRVAIQTARAYLRGEATAKDVASARADVEAAAAAANSKAAWAVAWALAEVGRAAASNAAGAVAEAADSDTARDEKMALYLSWTRDVLAA